MRIDVRTDDPSEWRSVRPLLNGRDMTSIGVVMADEERGEIELYIRDENGRRLSRRRACLLQQDGESHGDYLRRDAAHADQWLWFETALSRGLVTLEPV